MINAINGLSGGWWAWIAPLSVQVAVLGTFAWLVDMLLKKRGWPQVRYALWLVVFAKLLLPPGFALPTSIPGALLTATPAPQAVVASSSPAPAEAALAPVAAEAVESPPAAVEAASPTLSLESWAMLLWVAGVAVLCVWLVRRLTSLRRLLRTSRSAQSEWLEDLLADCAGRLALKKLPHVVTTDKVKSPAVFGILRPVILFPEGSLAQSSRLETEHVLLHELAHIKRRDILVNAAQTLLHIAFWFHPLVWLAGKRSRNLRELCCDTTVAGVLGEQTPRYRATLIETARSVVQANSPLGIGLLGLFENQSTLKARLLHLSRPLWKHRKLKYAAAAAAAVATTLLIVPMARPQKAASEPAATTPFSFSILAVSKGNSGSGPWWDASGAPLAEPPIDPHDPMFTATEGRQLYELVYKVTEPRDADYTYRLAPPPRMHGCRTARKDDQSLGDTYSTCFDVPDGTPTIDVLVGLADGPWETVKSHSGKNALSYSSGGTTVFFSEAFDSPEGLRTTITCSHDAESAQRIVAVDHAGGVHVSARASSGAGGFMQHSLTFRGLTRKDLKGIRIERCPYTWTTILSIPLAPAVEDSTDTASATTEEAAAPMTKPLTGTVLDEHGQPVVGLEVTAYMQPRKKGGTDPVTARTGAKGAFQMDVPIRRPDRLNICALRARSASGVCITKSAWWPGAAAYEPVEMILAPSDGVIAGKVIDDLGNAVAGAKVQVYNVSPTGHNSLSDRVYVAYYKPLGETVATLTASDGSFRVESLPHGWHAVLEISGEGIATDQQPTRAFGPEKTFTVPRAAVIAGRVVAWEPDVSVADIQVDVRGGSERMHVSTVTSEPDGSFVINSLPSGTFYVIANRGKSDGEQWAAVPSGAVTLKPGETLELTVEITRGVPVTGRILTAGTDEPMPGGAVVAKAVGTKTFLSTGIAYADDDGRFTLHLAPGLHSISFMGATSHDKYADMQSRELNVEKGKPVDVGDISLRFLPRSRLKRLPQYEKRGSRNLQRRLAPSDAFRHFDRVNTTAVKCITAVNC